MSLLYGIIGYPLAHSFSPAYFNARFASLSIDAVYKAFPLTDVNQLPALLAAHPQLSGLSVTIPHKQTVIPLLHELDAAASQIGAVNCISIQGGRLSGYNTDVVGFEQSLVPLLSHKPAHALVLGTGGSSRAVAWVLGRLGIPFHKVSRTPQPGCLTYQELDEAMVATSTLIVNTTPLGQSPAVDAAAPIPYSGIGSSHILFDLVYNPAETKFLSLGKARGAVICNGLSMLHLQAEAAWQIWTRNA